MARHAEIGGELRLPREAIGSADLAFLTADKLDICGSAFPPPSGSDADDGVALRLSSSRLDSVELRAPCLIGSTCRTQPPGIGKSWLRSRAVKVRLLRTLTVATSSCSIDRRPLRAMRMLDSSRTSAQSVSITSQTRF